MDSRRTGCKRVELLTGHAIGLAFSAQTGCISFLGVLVLFGIVFLKYRRSRKQSWGSRRQVLLRSNLDVYMINLFISELLMSLGGMLDAKWVNESAVYCGEYCNAQGSLQYIGETSVALWTLAVTLHTWQSVVYAQRIPFRWSLCVAVMGVIWGFVFIFNFVAFSLRPKSGDDSYFSPGPFWCWINPKYDDERLAGEYLWLWIAGFGNLLVYIPLFFLLRGNIILGNEGIRSHRWNWTPSPVCNAFKSETQSTSGSSMPDDTYDEENIRKEATKMLFYPLAYTILVLPLSVVRWSTFTVSELSAVRSVVNDTVEFYAPMASATLVFHAVFRLSGIINVVLVLTTRPNVLLFGDHHNGEDGDDAGHHRVSRGVYGGSESIDDASMRQRCNATSTDERVREYTGFGGLAVLNRRDDSITERR